MRFFVALNILILVLIVLRQLMKGKVSCRVQYFAWIILPVFMLVGSFITIPVAIEKQREVVDHQPETTVSMDASAVHEKVASYPSDRAYPYAGTIEDHAVPVSSQTSETPGRNIDYKLMAICLWVSVSAVIGSVLLVNNIAFAGKLRKERVLLSVSEYGKLKVYRIKGVDSPFLFWNRIYIPEDLNMDSDHYTLSVYHEYCHYKLGDCFWNVIKSLFVTVLWFDPLVWIAYYLIRHDNELAVDEMVIAQSGEENRVKYGEMLLSYVSKISGYNPLPSIATSVSGKSRSFMKKRILNIARRSGAKKYAAVIVCAVLITASVCLLIRPHIVYKDTDKPDSEVRTSSCKTEKDTGAAESSQSAPVEGNHTVPAASSDLSQERKVVNITYDLITGIVYHTDNLIGAEDFKIPEDISQRTKLFVNCNVISITENYMYVLIDGVDYETDEDICRFCRYEMVDGKQGDLTGSVDIDPFSYNISDVYEAEGKTYAILKMPKESMGTDPGYAFHIYELDFDNGTATEDRVVHLDTDPGRFIDIREARYNDGTIYAYGEATWHGETEYVYYEITEDGQTQIDLDSRTESKFWRIVTPIYKL